MKENQALGGENQSCLPGDWETGQRRTPCQNGRTQKIYPWVATAERAKVEELKASIESLELEDREEVFAQIDKIEKEILDKYEKALDEVLPVAFSIVKATAKRFTENEEIVVTATDFDRQLAATKDFVRIEAIRPFIRITG